MRSTFSSENTSTGCALSALPDTLSPQIKMAAEAFDLADVTLLEGPFQQAMHRDRDYMLSLEPDRLLHNFRKNAGLEPKAPIYGGWESTEVAGINLGHFMTAGALYFRATGDVRFAERLAYIVGELSLCQETNGNGYVAGIPNGKEMFAALAAGKADALQGAWVPWYPIHKILAGLRDVYTYTGNALAKDVLLKLADWAVSTTSNLDDKQWQVMLKQEHGGMSEVLADIYALTNDTKYLELSRKFYHRALVDPLVNREDNLTGQHGNTQSPKLIGLARLYELTGDERGRIAGEFFWERVVQTRTFAIGGHTEHEHFGRPCELSDQMGISTAETCKTYNLLKLTRHLFSWTADVKYADFYERALYNHILASQDARQGMMAYFVSLRPGHFKTFSTPFDSFWCCVGTGMENHVKYGDSIYFHHDDTLFVNLFIPSLLKWKAKGLSVRQETNFPEGNSTLLTLTCTQAVEATIKVRYPSWTGQMVVTINGETQPVDDKPGSYVSLRRIWHNDDRIEIALPMNLYTEATPDNPNKVAILFGPIVLAGQLGSEGLEDPVPYAIDPWQFHNIADPAVPVLTTFGRPLKEWIKPIDGEPLAFQTVGAGDPHDVTVRPFYSTGQRYTVYWDFFTPETWAETKVSHWAEQQQRQQRHFDEFTVDEVTIGQGEVTDSNEISFELRIIPTIAHELIFSHNPESEESVFQVYVNDEAVFVPGSRHKAAGAWETIYRLPGEMTKPFDKPYLKIRLRFDSPDSARSVASCRTAHLMGR